MNSDRAAGVLLHISSLPSKIGIGDLGEWAFRFADFLHRSGQTFWQILPLSPTTAEQSWSPYSSYSSMAGNIMFISLEQLFSEGLLSKRDFLPGAHSHRRSDFKKILSFKEDLLKKAYQNSLSQGHSEFESFRRTQSFWLDDFAMYVVSKTANKNLPWYQWPNSLRSRNENAIRKFVQDHAEDLNRVKWYQYIFDKQWKALKSYCNGLGISIIGDLPFYVAHDSVDVWSDQEVFKLKKSGTMAGVAGVPPDYFNSDGQLWGMPVYNWDVLKKRKFDWWINRLRKNMELVDCLRLDHFRAFDKFWEVPANDKNAIGGKWKAAPGKELFYALREKFGSLPFIAEDLGDVDEKVFDLRDEFELPGMKVLQFAFNDHMAASPHIPHNFEKNFAVYTGTHDNNTSRGWFRREVKSDVKGQIKKYFGQPITDKNIHIKMIQLAYASVADLCIIPMQDVLGLDEKSRMNVPATTAGNWQWRMSSIKDAKRQEKWLRNLAELYGRLGSQKN
jgi:4-alpha-glucanotransferase